ncbi:hypothetical protein LY76DRAFT_242562 [Colletotrichum caudatum]|nr:hypothetical protein LY76DRAFT_242562 [Colletotrichum caudatum]
MPSAVDTCGAGSRSNEGGRGRRCAHRATLLSAILCSGCVCVCVCVCVYVISRMAGEGHIVPSTRPGMRSRRARGCGLNPPPFPPPLFSRSKWCSFSNTPFGQAGEKLCLDDEASGSWLNGSWRLHRMHIHPPPLCKMSPSPSLSTPTFHPELPPYGAGSRSGVPGSRLSTDPSLPLTPTSWCCSGSGSFAAARLP